MAYSTKIIIATLLYLSLDLIGYVSSQSPPRPNNVVQTHGRTNRTQGRWEILQQTIGIVAMHMAVTRFNTVVMFDQTGAGPSRYRLPRRFGGNATRCSADTVDADCFAHSVEYDVAANQVRPLRIETDPWFSSGAFLSDGTLLGTGGFGDGARQVRRFTPCEGGGACDWREDRAQLLADERWYSAAVVLPEREERVMVVGGRNAFSYEFVPKRTDGEASFALPLLTSSDSGRPSSRTSLYPFVHLSADGNLFIFAVRDSILFDYRQNRVVRTFPRIPGSGYRTHPSTGSSVILPLDHSNNFSHVEVMVCGGAAQGAYSSARRRHLFSSALRTCGRIVISSPAGTATAAASPPRWRMESMPRGRVMGDMILLPTGKVLIINGAERGAAGWDSGRRASRRPYLYGPSRPRGRRFSLLRATSVPRMYRSAAVLLPDGRVIVGGSNPHNRYRYDNVKYPTELRLQAFVPHYMEPRYDQRRPANVTVRYDGGGSAARYGEEFVVTFALGSRLSDDVVFAAYAPPFAAHSASPNQRMLRLRANSVVGTNDDLISAVLVAPPNANVAPAGYYMLTVVNAGVPSVSQWIRFTHNDDDHDM